MSNICATILAICSLIGIFVACEVEELGIEVFLCVMYACMYFDAVRIRPKTNEPERDKDEERSPLLGKEDE